MTSKTSIFMNKVLTLLFVFLLHTSFAVREPDYCKLIDKLVKSYLKECVYPRGLVLSGYGGSMMDDIKKVNLSLISFATLTVDEARVLYVEIAEGLLRRINADEKLRPFLHNYPFVMDNLDIMLGFEDARRRILSDGHVSLMFLGREETLVFEASDPATREFYTLHREPYEAAYKKVCE